MTTSYIQFNRESRALKNTLMRKAIDYHGSDGFSDWDMATTQVEGLCEYLLTDIDRFNIVYPQLKKVIKSYRRYNEKQSRNRGAQ